MQRTNSRFWTQVVNQMKKPIIFQAKRPLTEALTDNTVVLLKKWPFTKCFTEKVKLRKKNLKLGRRRGSWSYLSWRLLSVLLLHSLSRAGAEIKKRLEEGLWNSDNLDQMTMTQIELGHRTSFTAIWLNSKITKRWNLKKCVMMKLWTFKLPRLVLALYKAHTINNKEWKIKMMEFQNLKQKIKKSSHAKV